MISNELLLFSKAKNYTLEINCWGQKTVEDIYYIKGTHHLHSCLNELGEIEQIKQTRKVWV